MYKNIILYGPPGTGKTYATRKIALTKILETLEKDEKLLDNHKITSNRESFDYLLSSNQIRFVTFHPSYSYEDFIEGIKPEVRRRSVIYTVQDGIFKQMAKLARRNPSKNFVLIIDEINRGNIPSIFGELITLIEEDKREGERNAISVTLPYSQEKFSVPSNLYIIGTMNTADKSIALLDIALRRRFSFIEIMPDVNILDGVIVYMREEGNNNSKINLNLNLKDLLKNINEKISKDIGRNYAIGHAYFLQYAEEGPNGEMYIDIKKLNMVFKDKIIPLLQEYTNDDWEQMHKILGDKFINKDNQNITDSLRTLGLGSDDFKTLYE